jgi:hypothetical protein
MYKQKREFIITIKYNSDNNDPNDMTELQEKLEDIFWLANGETVEILSIKQTTGEQQ